MKNNHKPAVVVIGGGVIGAAVTYYLSKAGIPVVLVERDDLASGTSGACSAFIWLGTKKPGIHLTLARSSLELMQDLVNDLDHEIENQLCGEMLLIETEGDLQFMKDFVARQRQGGVDIRLLTRSEAKEMQPALAEERIVGATYSPLGMLVNSIEFVLGLIKSAEKMGAEIRLRTKVKNIATEGGRVRAVRTDRGHIETSCVVNAAGVDAPEIGAMVGIKIPIIPLRGQILVTEPAPPLLRVPTIESRYLAVKRDPELLKKTTRSGVTCGIWQSVRGNIYLGSSKEFVGYNRGITQEAMATIAQKTITFYPGLAGLQVIRAYAGLRPYTEDGLPILGRVEGFILATGHGGDGVALSPITGKLISELIVTGKPSIPIEKLGLSRFG
jgi:sarcosine oxidase subunit beta